MELKIDNVDEEGGINNIEDELTNIGDGEYEEEESGEDIVGNGHHARYNRLTDGVHGLYG